ncbi:MAG: hypothetical protein IJ726_08880 [Phocaeicola sp.]|nr:hypothetical protein [Phocaeicola sp.]
MEGHDWIMSRSVDTRVVEMQFDNAAFERGVQQTMSSLAALDKKLNAGTNVNQFQNLENSANKVKFTKLQSALGTVVSGLETVGSKALNVFGTMATSVESFAKIATLSVAGIGTALAGIAITGGWNRAANIEQAKFQLRGLGIEWKDIVDDLNYAVDGTAYGLDSAAKVASQLVASNVEVGDSMKTALRAISGTAAMTNRSYDDIGHIFTAVAGQGKVMTQQLRQLELSGLNAAATLGKALDKSEGEIRDMVSKGQIDFATFAKAMNDAFGEHATKANETFTGALSNVKAALSRIGAEFATPLRDNIRLVLVDLIQFFKDIKTVTDPIAVVFGDTLSAFTDKITYFLETLHDSGAIKEFGENLQIAVNAWRYFSDQNVSGSNLGISKVFSDMSKHVKVSLDSMKKLELQGVPIFDLMAAKLETTREGIEEMATSGQLNFKQLADVMVENNYAFDNVKHLAFTAASVMHNLGYTFKSVGDNIKSGFVDVFGELTVTGPQIKEFLDNVRKFFIDLRPSKSTLNQIHDASFKLFTVMKTVGTVALGALKSLSTVLQPFGELLWTAFLKGVDVIYNFHNAILELVSVDDIQGFFDKVAEKARNFFNSIREGLPDLSKGNELFEKFKQVLKGAGDMAQTVSEVVKGVLAPVIETFKAIFRDIFGDFGIGDLFAMLNASGTIGLATSLSGLVTTLRQMKSTFEKGGFLELLTGTGLDKIVGTFEKLGGVFQAWQTNLNASMLVKLAGAVALLALSVTLLAKQNPEQLMQGVVVLGVLMAELAKFMEFLLELEFFANGAGGITGMAKLGTMFISLSASLLLMTAAVNILGSMDPEKALQGIVGLGLIMVELVGFMYFLDDFMGYKDSVKTVTGIIGKLIPLAMSMILFAAAVKILGSMDIESWAKGLGGLGIVMVEMMTMLAYMDSMMQYRDSGKQLAKVMASFIPVAIAMIGLAGVVKILGSMDFESWGKGLGGLAIVLGEMTAVMYALSKMENAGEVLAGAASILIVANAMVLMAGAMAILGTMNFESMGVAIFSMASAFLLIGVALEALSHIDFATESAIDIVLMAGAIAILAPAMALLSAIPLEGVGAALASIAGAFLVFGAAAVAMSKIDFEMKAFATTLLMISAAALMTGAAITLVAVGLATLAGIAGPALQNLGDVITVALGAVVELIPLMAERISEGFLRVAENIAAKADRFTEAGLTVFSAMLKGIVTLIPEIANAGLQLVTSLLEAVTSYLPQILELGFQIITQIILGIAQALPQLIDAGFKMIIAFVNGVADALRNNTDAIFDAIENLVTAIGSFLLEGIARLVSNIPGVGPGIADQIRGWSKDIFPAAKEAASSMEDGFKASEGGVVDSVDNEMSSAVGRVEEGGDELGIAAEGAAEQFNSSLGGNLDVMTPMNDVVSVMQSYDDTLAVTGIGNADSYIGAMTGQLDSATINPEISGIADAASQVDPQFNSAGDTNAAKYIEGASSGVSNRSDTVTGQVRSMVNQMGSVSSRGDGESVGSNFGWGVYNGID